MIEECEEIFSKDEINEVIIDMIDYHILVCDLEGQIVFSNKAVRSYLGYGELELKQKNFLNIISDTYKDKAKSCIESVTNEPSNWEEVLFDGKCNTMQLHLKFFQKDDLIYIYGNERYVEHERLRKKLDKEISNAVKIHKRSLPESLPNTENISFASLYIPAEKLGGDLFDAFKVDNGLLDDYFEQYVGFVSDVSGHGLDSAMLSIFVKDTISNYFRLRHIPGQVLSPKEIMDFFVERYTEEGYPDEYLVCLFLFVFDLKTNELIYCNAGVHTCPLLIRDEKNIIELDKMGLPVSTGLGIDLLKYEDYSQRLTPEMLLLIMTDGLLEQKSNGEFYESRLKSLLAENCCQKPDDIIEKIHGDFTDFLSHEKIDDDITLVAVKLS